MLILIVELRKTATQEGNIDNETSGIMKTHELH